jgi:hypothetical protein
LRSLAWFGLGLQLCLAKNLFNSGDATVRLVAGAAWFAPLVIFGFLGSAWVLGVVVVMAATVTRAFRYFGSAENVSGVSRPVSTISQSLPNKMFESADPPSSFRPLLWPFLIAICVQAGAVIAVAGYKLLAAMVLGTSTTMLAWSFPLPAAGSGSARGRRWFLGLALALALVLTAIGLAPFLEYQGSASRAGALVRAVLHAIFGGKAMQSSAPPKSAEVKDLNATGTYKGVILWPQEPHAIMLAPPPPEMPSGFAIPGRDNPLSLPFHGVYWFYKFPDTRPPEHSYKVRGSPEKMGMHSSDEYPLLMEAHQDISSLIDLKCCGRVQVAVHNADRHPGTVSLELRLRNRTPAGQALPIFGSSHDYIEITR